MDRQFSFIQSWAKFAVCAGVAVVSASGFAVRPKTVYLVQHTHSDIGYARP